MDSFNVKVHLRIVTPSESEIGKLLILVDDNGNIPEFNLSKDSSIDEQIYAILNKIFYGGDLDIIISTKSISSISNDVDNIQIFYNFITPSTSSKIGSFIHFNKQSLELYRNK